MHKIFKVGLAIISDNKILLVKKKGQNKLIIPGGKPKEGEKNEKALRREIKEELKSSIDILEVDTLETFSDKALDEDAEVTIELYAGIISDDPKPGNEIEKIVWFSPADNQEILSPIIKNKILPFLTDKGYFK